MAWQVAVVFDEDQSEETLHANLFILLGQMPVWVVASYQRVPNAAELRGQWDNCWHPEPALTVISPTLTQEPIAGILDLLGTIQEHHPRVCAFRLFGVARSTHLERDLAGINFYPVSGTIWDGLGFAKPLNRIEDVPNIEMNASGWKSEEDFYVAFFHAVGAPEWHGKNLDALDDSIGAGRINKVEVPYRLILRDSRLASPEALRFIHDLAELISDLQINGCPVELRVES